MKEFMTMENIVTPRICNTAVEAFSVIEIGWLSPYPTVDRVVNIKYMLMITLSITGVFSPGIPEHSWCLRSLTTTQ
jgi:hypothetical protein